MYYDEDIINGVLSFRTDPHGEWTPMSAEQITTMYSELKEQSKKHFDLWCADADRLTKISAIAAGQGTPAEGAA